MCMICLHFAAGKLTATEAMRNLNEVTAEIGPKHTRAIAEMIIESEIQRIERDYRANKKEEDIQPIDFGGQEINYLV